MNATPRPFLFLVFIALLFIFALAISGQTYYDDSQYAKEETANSGNASGNEGEWDGGWRCQLSGLDYATEGAMTLTVAGNEVKGELESETASGTVSGRIEGDKLIAVAIIPCPVTGKLVEYEWNGLIVESDAGKTVKSIEGGSCEWEGKKKDDGGVVAPPPVQPPVAPPPAVVPPRVTEYANVTGVSQGSEINLTYAPVCIENCTKIVFMQVVCSRAYFQDGTNKYFEHQSDSSPKWVFQDADEVDGGVWGKCVIDYINGENDPYYNGDDASDKVGKQGKHAGNLNATMYDAPRILPGDFTTLEAKWGKNVSRISYEFEVCAFCAQGADAGAYYGCIAWEFTQVKGGAGASRVGGSYKPPSPIFKDAVDNWGKNHGFAVPKK